MTSPHCKSCPKANDQNACEKRELVSIDPSTDRIIAQREKRGVRTVSLRSRSSFSSCRPSDHNPCTSTNKARGIGKMLTRLPPHLVHPLEDNCAVVIHALRSSL